MMKFIPKLFLLLFLLIFLNLKNFANPMQVSLITCGTGEEVYESFGHSGIRIVDSADATDVIYNYGMFDFGAPNFILKFTRGTLLYFSAKMPSEQFLYEYEMNKREVKEQILDIDSTQKQKIKNILEDQLQESKTYYHYDFLFNNCSTKLRDVFDSVFKNTIKYQEVLPKDRLTFMQMLNSYLQQNHWERVGIDMILCSKVNAKMTNRESMFLPEWLFKNIAKSTVNGKSIVKETKYILPKVEKNNIIFNQPKWIFLFVAIIFIAIGLYKPNLQFWKYFDGFLFSTLGLLGVFFLFMWFFTDHVETNHNLNMLWAMPTHIAFVYLVSKNKIKNYATVCFVLAIFALLIAHPFIQSTAKEIYPIIALVIFRLFNYTKWKKNL